jgi:hypothetical protein
MWVRCTSQNLTAQWRRRGGRVTSVTGVVWKRLSESVVQTFFLRFFPVESFVRAVGAELGVVRDRVVGFWGDRKKTKIAK